MRLELRPQIDDFERDAEPGAVFRKAFEDGGFFRIRGFTAEEGVQGEHLEASPLCQNEGAEAVHAAGDGNGKAPPAVFAEGAFNDGRIGWHYRIWSRNCFSLGWRGALKMRSGVSISRIWP